MIVDCSNGVVSGATFYDYDLSLDQIESELRRLAA